MFKIALNAGHYLGTAGKRVMKALDPAETREWVLNSRICELIEQKLTAYTGYELLRIDDRSGKTDKSISERAAEANEFGADIYVSVHHNAGIGGGSGGGVMAYVYTRVDDTTRRLQTVLYDELAAATGLRGNRVTPKSTGDFGELRMTRMPAVLLECGFMDSTTDVPIILTREFAEKAAEGIVAGIVKFAGLEKKSAPAPAPAPETNGLYYVQTGAFRERKNAEAQVEKLKAAGFNAFIKVE